MPLASNFAVSVSIFFLFAVSNSSHANYCQEIARFTLYPSVLSCSRNLRFEGGYQGEIVVQPDKHFCENRRTEHSRILLSTHP